MSLNPIVALSEQFQKLINEHGSSAILRDHLALFKDQVLMLEKENLRLINESGVYKVSEEKLKSDIEHLKKENEILWSKIQEYEQPSHNDLLEQQKVNILVYLSENGAAKSDEISSTLSIGKQVVNFHLEELAAINMTVDSRIMGSTCWSLGQEGRRYLVKNALIA